MHEYLINYKGISLAHHHELISPADVFIPNWHNGQAAALDVCIVAPARSTPNSPAKDFNAHIDDSYIAKLNSHENDCRSVGVLFFPIVFSTGGAIHPKSMPIIERIAELKAGRLGLSAKVEKSTSFIGLELESKKGMHIASTPHGICPSNCSAS